MPELPEVESVRLGLERHLPGAKIETVSNRHPRALASNSLAPLSVLKGLTVERVHRRGKYLWFTFKQDEHVLIAHLGMSGQFRVFKKRAEIEAPFHPHVRVSFTLRKGRKDLRLDFLDQRTFGWMRIDTFDRNKHTSGHPSGSESLRAVPRSIQHVAPDPFEEEFDSAAVIARLRAKRMEIKRAILDQETLSGVGNIYADEALWRAKIHPQRQSMSLTESELKRLITAIRSVMERAMKSGGTSFDHLYVNVNGESGYFSTRLAVYGREGERCRRCAGEIHRIIFTNRSSHFCPQCQSEP